MVLVPSSPQRHPLSFYLALGSFSLLAWTGVGKTLKAEASVRFQKPLMAASSHLQTCFRMKPQLLSKPARSGPFEAFIQLAARENRLDPRLLKAVIQAESQFNPYDISPAGACGLMQLMPRTARLLSVTDIFDPEQNIRAGAKHLRYLLTKFSNDVALSLAAYNAGEVPVRRYKGIPPFPETQHYVKHVLKLYESSLS